LEPVKPCGDFTELPGNRQLVAHRLEFVPQLGDLGSVFAFRVTERQLGSPQKMRPCKEFRARSDSEGTDCALASVPLSQRG
jgi:hypothetical protein